MITVYVMTFMLIFSDGYKVTFQVERTKEDCTKALEFHSRKAQTIATGSCFPRQVKPNAMMDFGYGVMSHWIFGEPITSEQHIAEET